MSSILSVLREQEKQKRDRRLARYAAKAAEVRRKAQAKLDELSRKARRVEERHGPFALPRAVRELPLFQFNTRNPVLKDRVALTQWVMWKVLETYGCLQTIGQLDMSQGMRDYGTLISGSVQQGKSETIILLMWVVWIQLGYCGILLLRNTGSKGQREDMWRSGG